MKVSFLFTIEISFPFDYYLNDKSFKFFRSVFVSLIEHNKIEIERILKFKKKKVAFLTA